MDVRKLCEGDRGAGLVEYALVVLLIGIVSMVAVRSLGEETSDTFMAIGDGVSASEEVEDDMSPDEKSDQAKGDYDAAIEDAKSAKAAANDKAKADYDAAVQSNNDLPKAEKNAANKEAKANYNEAKSTNNDNYKSSVAAAKATRDAAKAEYKDTK